MPSWPSTPQTLSSPTEGGSLTPVRDSPCTPRLRSVSSYGNIRAVTTARNLNKSLQNLSLTEEREMLALGVGFGGGRLLSAAFSRPRPPADSVCPARLEIVVGTPSHHGSPCRSQPGTAWQARS